MRDIPFRVVFGFKPALPLDRSLDDLRLPAVENLVAARHDI